MIRRLAALPEGVFLLLQLAAMVTGLYLFYTSWTGSGDTTDFRAVVLILIGLLLQIAPLWLGWRVRLERSRRRRGY